MVVAQFGGALAPRTHRQSVAPRRVPICARPDRKIEEYLDAHNDNPKPFVWTATADDILAKVACGRVALQAVNQ
jgi:hypothetical protein